MSLKFLLETQMVILMLCNSVLMRLLTTSALSFSVSFDCELHPLYSARPRRTYHSLRISTEPMITQSAQPPLPFLTAGEGPPETARLASVTRRSVVRGSFGASAARTANSFSQSDPHGAGQRLTRGIHVTPFVSKHRRGPMTSFRVKTTRATRRSCRSFHYVSRCHRYSRRIPATLGAGGSRQQGHKLRSIAG